MLYDDGGNLVYVKHLNKGLFGNLQREALDHDPESSVRGEVSKLEGSNYMFLSILLLL